MTKQEIKNRENEMIDLIATFSAKKLDDDYFQLCKKLIKKLARKRDVPFIRGRIEIWAASVVYAIGSINFLFDKSFEPFVSEKQVCEYFGTKISTVSNKAKQIKDMFDLRHFSTEFSTRKLTKDNPFNNLVMVDGFIVSLDSIPENMQRLVKETRAEGRDIEFTTEPQ